MGLWNEVRTYWPRQDRADGVPQECRRPSLRQVIDLYGGASRDRTDDLIVANDTVHHFIVLNRLDLSSGYGPLRSNSQIGSPGVASQLARSTRKKFEETGG